MTNQEPIKPIVLTTEQIKKHGNHLIAILTQIELIQQLCDASLIVCDSELKAVFIQQQMKNALSAILDYSQKLYEELDTIACDLILCDDETEVQHDR